jgi:DNA-binding CsgD family transcriptional regulator/methylmalonyl-CoA mutase cobalamin-binding subunit
MSAKSPALVEGPRELLEPPTAMLVCAAEPGLEQAQVSLADGVYETGHERVFWRGTPDREVLRLPLGVPVATRPLKRVPQQRASVRPGGEQALLHAVQVCRTQADSPGVAPAEPLIAGCALGRALLAGDPDLAYAHAVLLWKQSGLHATYQSMSDCLAALASSWAAGTGSVLAEHRATRTMAQVADRLALLTPSPNRCGTVILTVPSGDAHTVVLTVLSHLIREAGRPVQVVDALPVPELQALAAAPGTIAVLLSVHNPKTAAELRSLTRDLRAADPAVMIVLGGPGLPQATTATFGADLVSDDLGEVLALLATFDSALTDRERQVLSAVADGLTNGDIAHLLAVAPATVKSHLDNIFAKTQTEHRAAAVARALRRGWIS